MASHCAMGLPPLGEGDAFRAGQWDGQRSKVPIIRFRYFFGRRRLGVRLTGFLPQRQETKETVPKKQFKSRINFLWT